MTAGTRLKAIRSRRAPGGAPRKRHWLRLIAIGAATIIVLIVLGAWAFVKFQSTAAPLALPSGPSSAPSGPLDGSWAAVSESVAGFRVPETALGMSNDVVGRTSSVTGTAVISDGSVTSAAFRVDLAAITVNGKTPPQLSTSLDTGQYPDATVTLATPTALSSAFAAGATVSFTAGGQLAMNGTAAPVTIRFSARRNGTSLQLVGSMPVVFSAWHITAPAGYGVLGSLADHGTAEFLLTLRRL